MEELPDVVRRYIVALVRGGFETKDQIRKIICKEIILPEKVDTSAVVKEIEYQSAALRKESEAWPTMTDWDRLARAFARLGQAAVIALHNAGVTISDGESDVAEAYHQAKNKKIIVGYCFYHWQDVDRAIQGGGLALAFGSLQDSIGAEAIGQRVAEELRVSGLETSWNGSADRRIIIPEFKWQRRML